MVEQRVQRRLAAIVAADVVGYSRLMEADEAGTLARLNGLRADLIDPRIAADGGRIVKTTGDGLLVEFASAVDAVRNALAIQGAMARRNADLAAERRMEFRVGINLGDVIVEGEDIHGDGVNLAARLEGLCAPGEVYVAGTVRDHVEGKLDASFDDLGDHTVKNIAKPVRVWRVRAVEDAGSGETEPALGDAERPSIAVLPFDNLSNDPDQEYFSDGISEDIITGLSRIRWFFVIARNSSFSYKGQSPDIREVAKDLGVRYVLEGSVRKAGNRVRITAQLIDGTTGKHVWAERYDRDLEDIFAVQDEITQTVVGAIEPELSRAEQDRARLKPPDNMDAWDCYLHGLWHVWRFNKADNLKAQEFFQRAVEHDAAFCVAFAGLAYAHEQAFGLGLSDAPEQSLEAAAQAARTAIALDERDAFACWAMGGLYFMRRDYNGSIEWLRRSIALNPSFAPSHGWLGYSLTMLGQPDEGIEYLDKMERLSPKDPLLWANYMMRSLAYLGQHDHETAEIWARKAVATPNVAIWGYCSHAAALAYLGRLDEAQSALAEVLRFKPDISVDFVNHSGPFNASIRDLIIDGLRKAGWDG